ncbi:TonB-dependent receptor [Allostella vacuolata]|nr:TonB-dependent receptor [Stella vacuolata]
MNGKAAHNQPALRLAALALSSAIGAQMVLPPAAAAQAGAAAPGSIQTSQAPVQRSFEIPPQPLPDALTLFGRQAGMQVSAHGDLVRRARTGGVAGTMTPEAALRQLLAGTGYTFRLDGNGAVILEQPLPGRSQATTLEPVMVQGAAPLDRHAGAADRSNSIAITAADLDRRNPTTLKGVFAGEATVSVGGAQPLSQKVYVQGVEETNLAVSIDGARQNNKVFHHSGTNLIDPALLKRARVDPGVAPADAGPGALGGAIAYETVDVADVLAPGRTVGGFVTGTYNSNGNTFTKAGSVFARADGFEILGFGQLANGSNYKDGNGNEMVGTGTDLKSFLGKTAYESTGGHRFEVSGEQVHDEAQRRFRANIGRLTNRNEGARLYDMKRQNFAFNYSMPNATGLWDPKIVLGYGRTRLGIPEPYGSIGETSSLSGKAENTFHLGPGNSITVGADFYDDKALYKDPSTKIRESATNTGLYAQARLTPVESLRLSFGLRGDRQRFKGVDDTEIDDSGLSANASVAYDVLQVVTLKAGYSRVFGGIVLAENFIMNEAWSYAQGMKAIEAENATLGFEVNHGGFHFGAGVFRSTFDHARKETFAGGPHLTADFRTQGYHLAAGYSWASGFVRATYTDTEFEVGGAFGDSDMGRYLGTPIGQIFRVEAAHRFADIGLTLGGTLDAALKNKDPVEYGLKPMKGYAVASLYAEYRPAFADYVTLRAEANNLFDAAYADRATYGQEFSNVLPLYEPGRSFLVRAKVDF